MADFTREELADYRSRVEAQRAKVRTVSTTIAVDFDTLLRLLSMAERAVSEETVRKLAAYERLADETELEDDHDRDGEAWDAFAEGACDDLRPAAAARLAAKGER